MAGQRFRRRLGRRMEPLQGRARRRQGLGARRVPRRRPAVAGGAVAPQRVSLRRSALAWGALPGRSPGAWVFAPSIALSFRDAGFTPAQAWPWWRRGFTAALAEKWRDAGISVTVAERWINGGFDDPDVAASWIEAGATPAEAALYLRACPDTDEALEWRDHGFDAGSIHGLAATPASPPTTHRTGRPGGSSPPTPGTGGRPGSAPSRRSCGGRSGSNRQRRGRLSRAVCGIRSRRFGPSVDLARIGGARKALPCR